MSSLPNYEVVLATCNRARVLPISLPTLLGQSHPPDRLIVVDSSEDPRPVQSAIEGIAARFPVPVLLLRSSRGLCHQRNVGIARVTAPVVFLPDDDSLWYPGAASAICRVYARDSQDRIGGVCAAQAPVAPPGSLGDALRTPYALRTTDRLKNRLQPLRAKVEHALFPDPFILHGRERIAALGVPDWLAEEDAVPVEWSTGFRMTFRTDLVRRHGFDESLRDYSLFEDVDMSFAVMRTHLVVGANRASVFHYRDPSPRGRQAVLGFQQVLNRAYIIGKHTTPGSRSRRKLSGYGCYKALHYALAGWQEGSRQKCIGAIRAASASAALLRAPDHLFRTTYERAVGAASSSVV